MSSITGWADPDQRQVSYFPSNLHWEKSQILFYLIVQPVVIPDQQQPFELYNGGIKYVISTKE